MAKTSAEYSKDLHERRRAAGHCVTCGGGRDVAKFVNCQKCREYHREHYRRNRPKVRERQNAYSCAYGKQRRLLALARYGSRCACCGESNPGFLTFDHINNDGGKRRKSEGNGRQLVTWILNQETPPTDIRVLCWNCNSGREANGGICPHLTEE